MKKAIHIATGEKVAIKIMDKKSLGDDLPRTKLEIEALRDLSHQNICKLYEVIETMTTIFLVLEHCSGGELFDYIVERDRLEEDEARFFFRQIVAAVAFIHTQGYAHRDLKPENLLLDDDQNIKLIDFGLCAKPKGGMGSRLETFCGSPAYAAPELINGQEYLGSQVDIWSMGVLLYALLCGYLPFDDENVGTLYRKIQNGRYECPYWLSEDSKNLLSKMLVTHPRHRISVGSLLIHPWLNEGYSEAIKWPSIYKKNYLDESVVCEMSLCYGQPKQTVLAELENWKYNYMTATYFLLLLKKQKGRPLQLTCANTPLKLSNRQNLHVSWDLGGSLESGLDNADLLTLGSPKRDESSTAAGSVGHKASAATTEDFISNKENFAVPPPPTSHRKSRRAKTEVDDSRIGTPVKGSTDRQLGKLDDVFASPALNSSLEKRSRSVDGELNVKYAADHHGLILPNPFATPIKDPSRSSARKVFGSIEKRLDKVKNMLTPKKKVNDFSTSAQHQMTQTPRKVKNVQLHNVSVIHGWENADSVLETLRKALELRGAPCKQKGFTLRGKLKDPHTAKVTLVFELEICRLQQQSEEMLCISRKRFKGSTWQYKEVVEGMLKVLNSSVPNARCNRTSHV